MKIVYLLLMLASVQAVNAQTKGAKAPVAKTPAAKAQAPGGVHDFCTDIKKEVSEDKTQSDFTSPALYDPIYVPPVIIKRTINTNPEWAVDNSTVLFQTVTGLETIYDKTSDGGQNEKQEKGIVVTFEDNSRIVDDTTQISHDFTEDKTMAIRNVYMPIMDAANNDFTTKKIAKFSLAGQERTIPADTAAIYLHYFQCIKAGK